VLSWLILRGRCRDCGERISIRYPLVEAATAVFFAGVVWWALSVGALGVASGALATVSLVLAVVAYLYLAAISVALALIDIDTKRLPNVIVLPSYLVGAVLLAVSALLVGDVDALIGAAVGAAGLFLAYFLLALAYPRGMGFGDVKLAGVLGLYLGFLGWGELAVGAFGAFLLGGIFGIVLLIVQRAGRKTQIPFGPWMLAGAWVGIFVGRHLFSLYLGAFGLTGN
jgi:leader peptidase (prepilin peptidase) / N-methyltransferase